MKFVEKMEVELVERFYGQVWNQADEAVARNILHPDFRFRGSLGDERIGHQGFIDYMRTVHAALGNYQCIIEDVVWAELRVAARMSFTGIHRAPFMGVPASGHLITWAGAAFFTIADGRITELWVLGDIDAIRRQLGETMRPQSSANGIV